MSTTSAPPSAGAVSSAASTSATPTSTPCAAAPPAPGPAPSSTPAPAAADSSSSLYALGIQAQDIAGEIALAAELLDAEDPAERASAEALINGYLEAAHHTNGLITDKADAVCRYIDHLRAVAAFRRDQAARLAALADADARRADALQDYMTGVLCRLHPGATQFSLPTHELRSRKSTAVVITDPDAIPAHLRQQPKPQAEMPPAKSAIKAVLAAGQPVPGAELQERRSWSIR
jgi:hypothetical protein